jgi:hypothetical protein
MRLAIIPAKTSDRVEGVELVGLRRIGSLGHVPRLVLSAFGIARSAPNLCCAAG